VEAGAQAGVEANPIDMAYAARFGQQWGAKVNSPVDTGLPHPTLSVPVAGNEWHLPVVHPGNAGWAAPGSGVGMQHPAMPAEDGTVPATAPELAPDYSTVTPENVKIQDRPVPVPVDRPVPVPVSVQQRPAPFSIFPDHNALPIFQRPDPVIPQTMMPQPYISDYAGNPTYPFVGGAPLASGDTLLDPTASASPMPHMAGAPHPFAPDGAHGTLGQHPMAPSVPLRLTDFPPYSTVPESAQSAVEAATKAANDAALKSKLAGAESARFKQVPLPNGMDMRVPEDALASQGLAAHPSVPGALGFVPGYAGAGYQPGAGFAGYQPGAGFAGYQPGAGFAGYQPGAGFAGYPAMYYDPSQMAPMPGFPADGTVDPTLVAGAQGLPGAGLSNPFAHPVDEAAAEKLVPPQVAKLAREQREREAKMQKELAKLRNTAGMASVSPSEAVAMGLDPELLMDQTELGADPAEDARLATARSKIMEQQRRTQEAMLRAQAEAEKRGKYVSSVAAYIAQQQAALRNALRQEHMQREYLAQMHRRMAALEIDKRRVAAEYELAKLMGQYHQVQAEEDKLRNERIRETAIKGDLMNRIHALKGTIRSATSTIDALLTGTPEANSTAREQNAEMAEKRAEELAARAREVQQDADRAAVEAASNFAAQMEAEAIGGITKPTEAGAGAGTEGASGPAQPAPGASAAAAPAAAPAPGGEAAAAAPAQAEGADAAAAGAEAAAPA